MSPIKRFSLLVFIFSSVFYTVTGATCGDTDTPPDPSSGCCGIDLTDDKFENSGDVAFAQFPWIALLVHNSSGIDCTGTLISPRHVLTAAICTYSVPSHVHLGLVKNSAGPDCREVDGQQVCNNGIVNIPVVSVERHLLFLKDYWLQRDIAILTLAQRAPYNEFIRPICLPTSDITTLPNPLRLIDAGWQNDPDFIKDKYVRRYVVLPGLPLKRCQESYLPSLSVNLTDDYICAGGDKDLDPCRGDNGSLLMSEEKGRYTLEGILSYGFLACGNYGKPSYYSRIYQSLSWILKNTFL